MSFEDETRFLSLVRKVLDEGETRTGRNGDYRCIIGGSVEFDLTENKMPLMTHRRVFWRGVVAELKWFLDGSTDVADLQRQGVHIWDGNSSREYLDSRGLEDVKTNTIGPGYGYQWRKRRVDQIDRVISQLKYDRASRRIILCSWAVDDIDDMALPPCHVLAQFDVSNDNALTCIVYQRSWDLALGAPFNIASYALLTHYMAKMCGLEASRLVYNYGNAHIYESHIETYRQIVDESRCKPPPTVSMTISDIDHFVVELNGYEPAKSHRFSKMVV
jgi:thymidylate synthase